MNKMGAALLLKHTREDVFVRKAFYRFFLPSLLAYFGIAVGGIADCVFVGNAIGPTGLTAISIGEPVYMLFNTTAYALSIGGSIRYSSALSQGNVEEGNNIFINVFRVNLLFNVVVCGLGLLFLPQVLTFLGAGEPGTEVWQNCYALVRAQLLLVPVMFCQGIFYYFVNTDNNPRLAAFAFVVSNTLDVVFNYVFVVVMKLGVAGSVYSTGLGAAVMILISLTHFTGKKGHLRFTWPKFRFHPVAQSMKMGFATSIQYVYQFVTILVCNHVLMDMGGVVAVAVFGIVFYVATVSSTIYDAVSMALQPMVSTFLGEQNRENIRRTIRTALFVSLILSAVVTGVLELFPAQVGYAFGLRGAEELTMGVTAMRVYAICILPTAVNVVMTYYYQAMEKTVQSYIIFTLRSFFLFLLFAFVLGRAGVAAFWWTYPCAELVTLLGLACYNGKARSWLRLGAEDKRIFTAFLESRTADLGQVEKEVSEYMESLEASPTQSYFATIAVEEVCGVILERAFDRTAGYIQLTIVPHEDKTVTIHLRDNARKFNPFALDTDEIHLLEGEGLDRLGIQMIKRKAKEFFYRQYAGFNTMVVRV